MLNQFPKVTHWQRRDPSLQPSEAKAHVFRHTLLTPLSGSRRIIPVHLFLFLIAYLFEKVCPCTPQNS